MVVHKVFLNQALVIYFPIFTVTHSSYIKDGVFIIVIICNESKNPKKNPSCGLPEHQKSTKFRSLVLDTPSKWTQNSHTDKKTCFICLYKSTILLLQSSHYYTDSIALTPNSFKWTVLGSKGSLPPPHHQGQLWTVLPCDWIAFRQFISLKMFTSPFRFGAPWRLTLVAIVMFHRG